MKKFFKILVYGFGNPGRQDDGLGIEFANRLESWTKEKAMEGFEFDTNYQLNIEDADTISTRDLVIFADASTEDIDSFCVTRVTGTDDVAFTSHEASPGYILKLSKDLFDKNPYTLLVHLKGYEWELKEGLTEKAKQNLEDALGFFRKRIAEPDSLFKLPGESNQKCIDKN